MKLEKTCDDCTFKTSNPKSWSNHRRGCNKGIPTHVAFYSRHKGEILSKSKAYRRGVKIRIFEALGETCVICGFSNKFALQIDHVNGGGYRHRKSVGTTRYYGDILRRIQAGSKNFQILCANCNQIQAILLKHKPSIWN